MGAPHQSWWDPHSDSPHDHPESHPPDRPACIQHRTFFGESIYPSRAPFAVSPFGVSRLSTLPLFDYLWAAQVAEGFLSLSGLDPFCRGSQRPLVKKPGPRWPIALGHLAQHATRTQWWLILVGLVLLSGICAAQGCSTVHNILLSHYGTRSHTMGASTSSFPSDSPLRWLLNNLDTLGLTPDIKPKNLICFCTQIWPTYPLDNQNHWPLFGSLDPNLLWDI
jgi:hypothetical protein